MAKWIRATEQLPIDSDCYKVYAVLQVNPVWENREEDGDMKWFVDLAYFSKKENKFYVYDDATEESQDCYDVEYWMELPESPVDELYYEYTSCDAYHSAMVDELNEKVDMLERHIRSLNKKLIEYEKKEWKHIV